MTLLAVTIFYYTLSAVTNMFALLLRCALHNIQCFQNNMLKKSLVNFSIVFEVAAIV